MLTLLESRLVLTESGSADGEWAFPPLGGKVGLDVVLGVRISKDPIGEIGSGPWLEKEDNLNKLFQSFTDFSLRNDNQFALQQILYTPSEILSGASLYGFVSNDPVNLIDFLGLTDIYLSQSEFDRIMRTAYNHVILDNEVRAAGEDLPAVGRLVRLAHLDIPEFANNGHNKDVFWNSSKCPPLRLGLGEELNYAKLGMYDHLNNDPTAAKMYLWKLLNYHITPNEPTKRWYRYGYDYTR